MCGIFAVLQKISSFNQSISKSIISKEFMKGQSRGPENSVLKEINNNLILGFHRLAINGLDDISNQPICIDGVYLICNGEIYNYKHILKNLNITPQTNSDCECIIHLYKKYGIQYTLENLDGVFSREIFESHFHNKAKIIPYFWMPKYSNVTDSSARKLDIYKEKNKISKTNLTIDVNC